LQNRQVLLLLWDSLWLPLIAVRRMSRSEGRWTSAPSDAASYLPSRALAPTRPGTFERTSQAHANLSCQPQTQPQHDTLPPSMVSQASATQPHRRRHISLVSPEMSHNRWGQPSLTADSNTAIGVAYHNYDGHKSPKDFSQPLIQSTVAAERFRRGQSPTAMQDQPRIPHEHSAAASVMDPQVLQAQESMRRLRQTASASASTSRFLPTKSFPPISENAEPPPAHRKGDLRSASPILIPSFPSRPSQRYPKDPAAGLELGQVVVDRRRKLSLSVTQHLVRCACCRRHLIVNKTALAVRCQECQHVSAASSTSLVSHSARQSPPGSSWPRQMR
jgi:hypothetical protein